MAILKREQETKIVIDPESLQKLEWLEGLIPSLVSATEQLNIATQDLKKATKEANKTLVKLERARRRPFIIKK